MIALAIVSFLILGSTVVVSIGRYGLLSCWSAYGEPWGEDSPRGLNVWSGANITAAALLIPPMIEIGAVSPFLQWGGFLCPLFLFLVGFTPDYTRTKTKNLIHQIGAWVSALLAAMWLIFIAREWFAILPAAVLASILAIGTNSARKSFLLWAEVAMFLAIYLTLFIQLS